MLTFNNSIIYPLLCGKDNVKMFVSVLEALRFRFDSAVPVQHVQYAILCVSGQLESRILSAYTSYISSSFVLENTGQRGEVTHTHSCVLGQSLHTQVVLQTIKGITHI